MDLQITRNFTENPRRNDKRLKGRKKRPGGDKKEPNGNENALKENSERQQTQLHFRNSSNIVTCISRNHCKSKRTKSDPPAGN
jgi:hypothetical protein